MAALAWAAAAVGAAKPLPHYAIVQRIPGGAEVFQWDYATIDSRLSRLYLGTYSYAPGNTYAGAISQFDLRTGEVIPALLADGLPHQVALLGNDLAAAADAANNTVIFFNELTGKKIAQVKTGNPSGAATLFEPDSLLTDPATGLLVAVNHDSGSIALVDPAHHRVVGGVKVGGVLESGVAAGGGLIFVNVASEAEIAVIDVRSQTVVRRMLLTNCEEPTGIAYDDDARLVISACSNGFAEFIDARSGAEVRRISVGQGADAVIYDYLRKIVFVAGGDSGTLSVISVGDGHDIRLLQTLRVPRGTRLGAVDVRTGRLYLPSVVLDLKTPLVRLRGLPALPRAVPGSFRLLVVAPS